MDMPLRSPMEKLDVEDKTFVWVKRQLDWDVGQKIVALNIKGIYNRKEYKRQYPEGSSRRISGFTMWKTISGRHGAGVRQGTSGKAGSRRVIKDRWPCGGGVGDGRARKDKIFSCPSTARSSTTPKQQVETFKAKAGSVVVMDAHTGELLALANYPSYDPGHRKNLTGEQLRNRALTDTFEPGRP
jgi:cell division protein FtsI (penicillin-binding protein 3)